MIHWYWSISQLCSKSSVHLVAIRNSSLGRSTTSSVSWLRKYLETYPSTPPIFQFIFLVLSMYMCKGEPCYSILNSVNSKSLLFWSQAESHLFDHWKWSIEPHTNVSILLFSFVSMYSRTLLFWTRLIRNPCYFEVKLNFVHLPSTWC